MWAWCEQAGLKVNGIAHSWAHSGDERLRHIFAFWPSRVSDSPLSHSRSIASPVKLLLLMMDQWGLFVIRWLYAPTPTPTIHPPDINIPMTPPKTTPRPHRPGQTNATLHNQYLKWKKIRGKSAQRPGSEPPLKHPPTHLSYALNASSQPELFALEAADWGSIADSLLLESWQGQQTRTSWQMKIIQQLRLIYLFLSLYLIWQWNNRQRTHDMSLSFICAPTMQEVFWGFVSAGCVRFQAFLPAMTFLENVFLFYPFWFLLKPGSQATGL